VARKQSSTVEDLAEIMEFIFRFVPPWLSIPGAIIAFWSISAWFSHKIENPGLEKFGYLFGGAVAAAMLVGGVKGRQYRRKQADFLRQNIPLDWVNAHPWSEFESLVGDIFRARGYSGANIGGAGADGGIDLRLTRNGEVALVQCKRWKVFKVGVKPIREFFGVMTSEGADRGIFVSSGLYTNEALRFAEGKALELIDGAQFAEMAKSFQKHWLGKQSAAATPLLSDTTPDRPKCPFCEKVMVLRRAKSGRNSGQEFWGCSAFPHCRGTRAVC
jgi:restriction system protein